MKVWVLLCTLFQICFAVPNTSHTILLEKINSRHSSWKAAKLFTEDTPEEFLKHRLGFLGVGRDAKINIKSHKTDTITIPESFDAREHWPGCEDVIGNIRDQGGCGSCWAFSSVEVMSDRLCIESEGEIKFELSPQNLVSCCRDCGHGCGGGYTYMAWNYFQKHGIVSGGDYNSSRGCQPYEALAFINGTTPECKESCQNPSYLTSYSTDLRLGDHYDKISPDVETIQVEIMTNGPVQASYTVYEDFGYYVSGFLPRMRSNPDKYSGFSDVKFSSIPDFLRGGAEYISHPLDTEVPENFDARKKWPECKSIQGIYAQGQCSSCWAVVTTSMLTDRTCIEFGGKENFEYSAEDLVTCCDDCSEGIHCKTGYPARALRYWIEEGIVSGGGIHSERGCMPYSNKSYYFKRDQKAEKTICGKTCTNSKFSGSYGKDKRFGKKMRVQVNTLGPSWNITDDAEKSSYKKAMAPLIKNIQIEIMLHGPVFAGGLMLTKDFINEYKAKEIYQYSGTADDLKDVGIHGVKIIGWGVENGVPYWLAANSWGTSWGDGGFFKILRGENHVQILNSVLASESLPPSSDAEVIKKSIFLLFSCFITLKGLL